MSGYSKIKLLIFCAVILIISAICLNVFSLQYIPKVISEITLRVAFGIVFGTIIGSIYGIFVKKPVRIEWLELTLSPIAAYAIKFGIFCASLGLIQGIGEAFGIKFLK